MISETQIQELSALIMRVAKDAESAYTKASIESRFPSSVDLSNLYKDSKEA